MLCNCVKYDSNFFPLVYLGIVHTYLLLCLVAPTVTVYLHTRFGYVVFAGGHFNYYTVYIL